MNLIAKINCVDSEIVLRVFCFVNVLPFICLSNLGVNVSTKSELDGVNGSNKNATKRRSDQPSTSALQIYEKQRKNTANTDLCGGRGIGINRSKRCIIKLRD